MSMIAIVTFDLHYAKSKHYNRVKRKLKTLKLEKQIRIKGKDKPTRLPANTFAAKFRGKWREKSASDLRNYLCDEVRAVISDLDLDASIFVAIGNEWAWGRRMVRTERK